MHVRSEKAKKNYSKPTLIMHSRLPETTVEDDGLVSIGPCLPWALASNSGNLAECKLEPNAVADPTFHLMRTSLHPLVRFSGMNFANNLCR